MTTAPAVQPAITQLERRRIEAEMLADVHAALCEVMPGPEAVAAIARATARAAHRAGAAFAAAAPGGPGLEHFAGVVDVWRAGGALDVQDVALDARTLRLTVTRCAYAELYIREMGLAPELAQALSCSRDAAFARGYSPRLHMERSRTIAQGAPHCAFLYRWDG
ncbi:L-2-amino-thiazoline-4-carboxylic acid hydrolase [Desulfocurvus vexinensis]|uniref:L-2-amino-thiazoline-4-carboxylic acid hydrolase n=1 Tax=Desulfocurvus vexinensis TaxID=399548 RepID=UPI00048F066D|nr:L-2-amino-thiazoline-4-carboxylic acid hydrolase [Desulfocurvus vexinensis]